MASQRISLKLGRVLRLGLIVAAAMLPGACSGDDHPHNKPPATVTLNPYAGYSIKVRVGDPGQERVIPLPPAPEAKRAPLQATISTASKPLVNAEIGDAGLIDIDSQGDPGWLLTMRAAAHCGSASVNVPWALGSWFVFAGKYDDVNRRPNFASCDETLRHGEILSCMANELAQIANGVRVVEWPEKSVSGVTWSDFGKRWVVPPQAAKDRFIARDAALMVLANLARLDLELPAGNTFDRGDTCADVYAKTTNPSLFDTYKLSLYGAPDPNNNPIYFSPKWQVLSTNASVLGDSRLRLNAHILRASGRLLKELTERSVYADLAGAEDQAARAGDPQRAASLMWGADSDYSKPYNSMAHALRVLSGRFETAQPDVPAPSPTNDAPLPSGDPECGGYAALDLMTNALDRGYSARWSDRMVTTTKQEEALAFIYASGIVIPKVKIDATNFSTVRSAIENQVLFAAAYAIGITDENSTAFSDFRASDRGQAILQSVAAIKDADLRFALNRAFGRYRLLAGAADTVDDVKWPNPVGAPSEGRAGVILGTPVRTHASLEALNGAVMTAPVPGADIVDAKARVVAAQAASQCPEYIPTGVQVGSASVGKRSAHQGAYSIAATYRRRLSNIREWATQLSSQLPANSKLESLADFASAELRAWAGPGEVWFHKLNSTTLELKVLGLEPKDLGVDTTNQMKSQLFLVWGEPWVASCAARTRIQCPATFVDEYIQTSVTQLVNTEISDLSTYRGSDGRVMLLTFNASGPPKFTPMETQVGNPSSEFLYLVSRGGPDNPGHGKVLAAFAYHDETAGWQLAPISKNKDELDRGLFDFNPNAVVDEPHIYGRDSTPPPDYCEGIPRDLFVPLENELTSDSDQYEDSWKHYLDLAEKAANEADTIGREIIDLGLQRDLRREAAGEELAKICGDFSALNDVKVEKGIVNDATENGALNTCLGAEPKTDVVFLTKDPLDGKWGNQSGLLPKQEIKKEYLGCEGSGGSGGVPPNTNELCDIPDENFTYDFLDLADKFEAPQFAPGNCQSPVDVIASFATPNKADGASFQKMDSLFPGQMANVVASLRLVVNANLDWELFHGVKIMSTTDTSYWPACLTSGCAPNTLAARFHEVFGQGITGVTALDRDRAFWRVSGAIWTMGALSGYLPADAFTLPLPAVNFGAVGTATAFPAIYGIGLFTTQAQGYALLTGGPGSQSVSQGERDNFVLPQSYGVTDGYAQQFDKDFAVGANTSTLSERPAWMQSLFDAVANANPPGEFTTEYLQVEAATKSYAFDKQDVGNVLNVLGNEINNLQGDSVNCTASNADAADYLEALKRPASVREVCYLDPNVSLFRYKEAGNDTYIADVFSQNLFPPCTPQAEKNVIPSFPEGIYKGKVFKNEVLGGNPCRHAVASGVPMPLIAPSCVNNVEASYSLDVDDPYLCFALTPDSIRRFTSRITSGCTKNDRAQLFVNSMRPKNSCVAGLEVSRAFALACILGNEYPAVPFDENNNDMPDLNDVNDLIRFEAWLNNEALRAHYYLSRLILQRVPQAVIDDFKNGLGGTGLYKGQHGQLLLQYGQDVSTIAIGWNNVQASFLKIRDAVGAAQLGLKAVKLEAQIKTKELALSQLQVEMQVAQSVAKAASGVVALTSFNTGGIGEMASAQIDLAFAAKENDIINQLNALTGVQEANQVAQVLQQLHASTGPEYTALKNQLEEIRAATLRVLATANSLYEKEGEAKYYAAKAGGGDFVDVGTGELEDVATFPVNAVLRRQYDIATRRYAEALKNARWFAYIARLAIEQRIGQRLIEMSEPIGPMEAPKLWADQLCALEGVNYEKLSEIVGADGGVSPLYRDYGESANPFIGDYVVKLRNFVEYYNIYFPMEEADDIAVLSVRDDLLGPRGQCYRESINHLHYSHALDQSDLPEDQTQQISIRGWARNLCSAEGDKCLVVDSGAALKDPPDKVLPPPEVGDGGATWLHDVANTPYATAEPTLPNTPPFNSVYQSVELAGPETYVLSWWDMARTATGGPVAPGGPGVPYAVSVYDQNWALVTALSTTDNLPFVSASGCGGGGSTCASDGACCSNRCLDGYCTAQWSPRRTLIFTAKASGIYHVAFHASTPGPNLGSVAIANVQLEAAPDEKSIQAYQDTDSSRLVWASDCSAGDAKAFRALFDYKCANNECFYELSEPILVDTRDLDTGKSKLVGKLARGNFNYRHITIAANVVGTAVNDCSSNPTPSCYGSAYVEYTLNHDAFAVPVIDYLHKWKVFNFGSGAIQRGKAIAAERFITLPIGSADLALLQQPQVEKPELRGRPLSGFYRLKVYDQPSLVWNNVEDIQLIWKYRYWSRVARENNP